MEIPSTHVDEKRIRNISQMPQGRLDSMLDAYEQYVAGDGASPRSLKVAERILNHVLFESMYRAENEIQS